MVYVALLRGINVGGNNKVDMKMLKYTFESLGFSNVRTYINSGNVIFEDESQSQNNIVAQIETAIERDFQLEIKVIIRDAKNIKTLCKKLPESWVKNEIMKTDIMFLWEEFDNADIINQLKSTEVDNIIYVPGAILWNVHIKNYNKSGIPKLIGTKIYKGMTIRNVNTVRKLHQLMCLS
jgi:uncharacterized protein (DUF1697 family)